MIYDIGPRSIAEIHARATRDEKKRQENLADDAPTVLWCNSDGEQAHLDRLTLLAALNSRAIPEPEKTLETRGKTQRGQFIGWCNTCGGETFNFVRHRCPPKIEDRALEVMRCASLLVRARICVRQSTNGTPHQWRMQVAETAAFDHLQAAVFAANLGNTNGEEG